MFDTEVWSLDKLLINYTWNATDKHALVSIDAPSSQYHAIYLYITIPCIRCYGNTQKNPKPTRCYTHYHITYICYMIMQIFGLYLHKLTQDTIMIIAQIIVYHRRSHQVVNFHPTNDRPEPGASVLVRMQVRYTTFGPCIVNLHKLMFASFHRTQTEWKCWLLVMNRRRRQPGKFHCLDA
jgi:hypothetical protein